MTALPACHVVSHQNSRRVAPLCPYSRAHARQTIGVTLFMFFPVAHPVQASELLGLLYKHHAGHPEHICRRVAPVENGA